MYSYGDVGFHFEYVRMSLSWFNACTSPCSNDGEVEAARNHEFSNQEQLVGTTSSPESETTEDMRKTWVAVKELHLSYHNRICANQTACFRYGSWV